jgi:phage tail sheath protein FI
MGDKTLSPLANAENRINVARLVNYLRYNLNNIAQPFIFEPNVQHTQDSAKTVMERFLSNLVTLNALYDFIVVCDSSNNTPDRIDNNELWIDIAIQPVKTIDFIYIPLRLEPTGTDLASLYSGSAGAVK